MPLFGLEHLRTDDDSMLHVQFQAASSGMSGRIEIYCDPIQLLKFASGLQEFPRNLQHVVAYEYGPKESWASYLSLKAWVLDATGRSAIEVRFENRLEPPHAAAGHFYLACFPASANELGRKRSAWASSPQDVFEYEWDWPAF